MTSTVIGGPARSKQSIRPVGRQNEWTRSPSRDATLRQRRFQPMRRLPHLVKGPAEDQDQLLSA